MADIDWPAGLPARPEIPSTSLTLGSGAARADLEVAPIWKRQRSTATPDRQMVEIIVSKAQVAILDPFYCVTCRYGSRRFNWLDVLGTAAEVRFRSPPEISNISGDVFRARFEIEVLK